VTPAVARFHDRRAVFVWIAALLWDGGALLAAWILAPESGGQSRAKALVALGVLGAAALGLTAWAFFSPVLTIEVRPDGGLALIRRYPVGLRRQILPAADVLGATVVEETFGDSGSYYVARVALRDRPPLDLLAKARRDVVGAEAARFNAALGRADVR
jgi:hypothetical protein